MAKFKVGDRVKVKPIYYGVEERNKIGVIHFVDVLNHYQVVFDDTKNIIPLIPEEHLELVEPQEDKPSKVVYDYRGHDDVFELIKGMNGAVIIVDQKDYCDSMLRDFAQSHNIDLRMYVDRSRNHFDKILGKHIQETPFKKPLIFHNNNEHDVLVGGKVKHFVTTDYKVDGIGSENMALTIKMVEIQRTVQEDKIKKAFERPMFSTEPLKKFDFPNPDELERQRRIMSIARGRCIPVKLSDLPYTLDDKGFIKHPQITPLGTNPPSRHIEFPYYHFSLDDDALDAIKYAFPPSVDYQRRILGIRTKPQPPKNRIPDRVVFNQDKGKVTVLISKHMDGVEPYWAYTSKVHGTDEYNGYFGFLLSYYKYLIRHLDAPTRKELIDNAFEFPDNKKFIFEGAITQEVLKVVKIQEWGNILDSIIEALKELNGYWDYAEWKEMLRVHELETKREHQKEISKQIKTHQLEIDKLKGDNDKK